jgi:hypothetical protein
LKALVEFRRFLLLLKSFRVFVKKYEFLTFFYKNRQKAEKQHIYTKNDDAEFEKEVFLHILLCLTKK